MEHQIIGTPTELDDRDLDLVAGGGGERGGGSTVINGSGDGNTFQSGILNVSLLNGNLDGLNLLSIL